MKKIIFLLTLITKTIYAVTIHVPADKPSIQDAIDSAKLGDTVQVASGEYRESISISKDISLIGAGAEKTIIKSSANEIVKIAQVLNGKFSGLSIDGLMTAKWGIIVEQSQIILSDINIRNIFNGIFCNGGSPTITSVELNDVISTAIQLNSSNTKINGIGVDRADSGIASVNSSFFVENSNIKNCSRGIYTGGVGSIFIIGNKITKSNCGIAASTETRTKLRRNIITQNTYGFCIDQSASADLGSVDELGVNQIHNNVEKDIEDNRSNKTITIPAEGNWWGVSPPNIKKFEGNVNYQNWLNVPPSQFKENINFSTNEDITVGEMFILSISVESFQPVAGWEFDLKFNPDILQAISSSEGNFFTVNDSKTFFQQGAINNELGLVSGLKSAQLGGSRKGFGTILEVEFKAKAIGKSPLTLTNYNFGDVNGQAVEMTIGTGQVDVIDVQPCDVNKDGTVNIFDLILVAQAFGEKVNSRSDTNGDGIVDILDLVVVANCFGQGAAPSIVNQSVAMFSLLQHWIALAEKENDGSEEYLEGILVLKSLLNALKPAETSLMVNYPNPFNPETWIPYNLGQDSEVLIHIYDTTGKVVKILDVGFQSVGYYTSRDKAAYWEGKTESGEQIASGTYFYRLQAGDYTETRKMVILK